MLQVKTYLKTLFTIFLLIGILVASYIYDFSQKYPPPITNRISLDAKLKFVRDNIDFETIDTVVVGSSLGLNNVLGSVLEISSKNIHHVLNLSVFEATTLQSEQLLALSDTFPNVKRIIYSAQYTDFPHARKYEVFDIKTLKKYMLNELSFLGLSNLLFKACNNLIFCGERAKNWHEKHMQHDSFGNLDFDYTGSSPLRIYRQKDVGGRWYLPHPGIMSQESFNAVGRMAKKAQDKGIHYYMVHQPYRPELVKKHQSVKDALSYFDKKILETLVYTNGVLVRLQKLPLNNKHFADRTHLNDKGATMVSREIARIIDEIERK